jgi:Uma2 family endonuclease
MMAPMSQPAKRPATYADLEALPEHVIGELIGGELIVSPRPAGLHTRIATNLTILLGDPFGFGRGGGPGGWWILFEPELHFGEDALVPDLAGWRRERLPTVDDLTYFTLAPDWVCEVLSDSTRRIDRVRKLPRHTAAGVRFVWVVDPKDKTLEVFRREESGSLTLSATFEGPAKVRAEPFDAVELDLGLLF